MLGLLELSAPPASLLLKYIISGIFILLGGTWIVCPTPRPELLILFLGFWFCWGYFNCLPHLPGLFLKPSGIWNFEPMTLWLWVESTNQYTTVLPPYHRHPVQTGPRLAGKVPPSGTFPGNHIVWTLAGTCPRVPTKHVGFRGRKSTLGLVIDIAQLFSSNVRMREMCWHGDLTQSRCAQQKPLNRDCPRQAGAFDDRVDGRS